MPGLSRELVEHQLPLKANVKPVKQPLRRFTLEVVQKIKEEIERLLKAKSIRTARCVSENLRKYFNVATKLLSEFDNVIVRHVPRELNQEANKLAQIASRYKIKSSTLEKLVRIKDIFMPLREREVLLLEKLDPKDWRVLIVEYLENPSLSVDRKLKYRAQSYVLMNNVLFKKSVDGNLLTCLGEKETYLALAEVHKGICGAHQSGKKMKWVTNRRKLYWPTIQRDCINYARSCEEYQKHGSL
ncbi:uncharacterized protein LOC110268352 [Arachis ipaensis]|uniref:uncharacterized protein LOC110268352 n=1 Tax=Arachis ipaensis TaxID=130454 RepID=UPI000A2B588E|nr:uncharacterized protein LOC110268352 [Arachis ipaensis]XP_025684693.1 uncharacterized protein LOC112785444 [Arachis hypogaea]